MIVSPAYAQAAGGGASGGLEAMLPLILIFVVFYFLLIRPQQKKMKQHKDTLSAIRRGDKVVTGGGIIGTVTKVDDDHQLTVEIAKDVKVKVHRDLISTVMSKTDPAKGAAPANDDKPKPFGFLSGLFGGGAKPAEAAAESKAEVSGEAKKAASSKVPNVAKKPRASKKTKASDDSGDSSEAKE